MLNTEFEKEKIDETREERTQAADFNSNKDS